VCAAPTSPATVYNKNFDTFGPTFVDNSITVTATATEPAYLRGQYFTAATPSYLTFTTAFKLHVMFTISTWLRLDDGTANRTIFSTDKTATPNLLFRAYINLTDRKLKATLAKPASVATVETLTSTSAVPEKDWTFVAIAIKLNTDGLTATVNFKINSAGDDTFTFASGHYYLDSAVDANAYIGTYRTGPTAFAESFQGFIFNFIVDNSYLTGVTTHLRLTCACSTGSPCVTTNTYCLTEADFDK
jgi:hypothetical protein